MGCLVVLSYAKAQSIKPTENGNPKSYAESPKTDTASSNPPKQSNSSPHSIRAYDGQTYTQDEVRGLITSYSIQFGIDSSVPLKIAKCESNYHWNSKNSNSTASGVFQFLHSTWLGTPEGKSGLSPFDADANVKAAIRKISEGGINAWDASKSCWQ